MAIYICSKCLFCFERSGEVEQCPDCAHINVRLANEKEIAEYKLNKDERNPETLNRLSGEPYGEQEKA